MQHMPMVLKVKHHEAMVATASEWAKTNEVSNKAGKAYLILRRSARPQRREDAPEESGPSSQQLQIQRSKDPSASKILFDGQFVEEESDDDVRLNSPSVHSQEEASIASALSRYDTVHDGTDSDVIKQPRSILRLLKQRVADAHAQKARGTTARTAQHVAAQRVQHADARKVPLRRKR
jgi:hypothetical protein